MELTDIVDAIREQRPGLLPEWLQPNGLYYRPWRDERVSDIALDEDHGDLHEDIARSIVEAALFGEWIRVDTPQRAEIEESVLASESLGERVVTVIRKNPWPLEHFYGPLAAILALCHAIGIELEVKA